MVYQELCEKPAKVDNWKTLDRHFRKQLQKGLNMELRVGVKFSQYKSQCDVIKLPAH